MRQSRRQSLLRFPRWWLVILLAFVAWSGLRKDRTGIVLGQILQDSPQIYTYFEKIDASKRTTGMTDEEDSDLLQLWRERWEEAGYTPVILTIDDANVFLQPSNGTKYKSNTHSSDVTLSKERLDSIRSKLENLPLDDFGKILFRRWVAMAAVGGGWFCDYDNFPLWNLSHEKMQHQLPNGAKMTVHDILSPTLASGSGSEWIDTLEALLDEAHRNCPPRSTGENGNATTNGREDFVHCFYTDSLGIHSMIASHHTLAPKSGRKVARPFDKNDPVSFNDSSLCSAKEFRTKLTVHFGPEDLQRGRHVPPNDRLPRHRSKLARDWLDRWKILCHENVTNR